MLINIIKFIHIIFVLILCGATIYCLAQVTAKKYALASLQNDTVTRLNKIILGCLGVAAVTGTLLVYPKHFTFHTPWIQAAYLFVVILSASIFLLLLFRKSLRSRWILGGSYVGLGVVLIAVIHDAVTKHTVW